MEVISSLQRINLKVVCTVCDQSSVNSSALSQLAMESRNRLDEKEIQSRFNRDDHGYGGPKGNEIKRLTGENEELREENEVIRKENREIKEELKEQRRLMNIYEKDRKKSNLVLTGMTMGTEDPRALKEVIETNKAEMSIPQ
ncbi:hypothetical protein QE152_g24954 [Popillia japonica]|uniref:Uncharacterized protein n=1 Tax=Popillia japonica TaxID=7064 RepID=A0AAW1K2Z9_POPJA